MKPLLLSFPLIIILSSCSKDFYGIYNTRESKDKSAFFEIKLNNDGTVVKTEIHTISDFAKGRFLVTDKTIICFFDSSKNKFPPDTLSFKLKGKKLYFVNNEIFDKKAFLVKQ